MNKEQIVQMLQHNHNLFIKHLRTLNESDFCFAPDGKWSAAQQLDHIVRSISPVNMAMGLPKFIIQWKFGLANRPSKSFEELMNKYKTKLKEGGRASGRFVPPIVEASKKEKLLEQLSQQVEKLSTKIIVQSEETLDKYILPHPLLGKLTLREMLYFTIYHVKHHEELVKNGLANQ
jgi:hypothetical protein